MRHAEGVPLAAAPGQGHGRGLRAPGPGCRLPSRSGPQAQNRQDEGGHPKGEEVEVRHALARQPSPAIEERDA